MIKKGLKIIVVMIIGMIIGSCISVYATYNYLASEIKYKKQDGTKISVENALNELYSRRNNTITFLDGMMTEDSSDLNMNYISDFKGKIIVVLTHVKGKNNDSVVKLNGVNIELIDTNSYKKDSYRKIEYATIEVEIGDILTCSTNSISANGATLIWSYSSCSLYGIK